jgi:hypothetical protein
MPKSYDEVSPNNGPGFRSKKRINKLVGKQSKGPVTRSRIASKDFGVDGEWSCFTNLQDLKKKKKRKVSC